MVRREGEDLDSLQRRFERRREGDLRRPWTKRHYGYYEKPSALRRRERRQGRLKARLQGRPGAHTAPSTMDMSALWERWGIEMAVGRSPRTATPALLERRWIRRLKAQRDRDESREP